MNNINEFIFDDYFEILAFNDYQVKYSFLENRNQILIILNNEEYIYNYELIEPEIIEEIKYVTETIYVDNYEYYEYEDNTIYYSTDYYEFALGTDLSTIIETVQDDIECYYNVTCDYSCLNPYELGEYSIYFYNDFNRITKIVKII